MLFAPETRGVDSPWPQSRLTAVTPYKPSTKDIPPDFILCWINSRNTETHVFSEVSTQDFEALANIVEKSHRKPRLSYHPSSGFLLVEMTTAAHGFAVTDFSRAVQPALDSLPVDRRHLRIALEPNLLLCSTPTGFHATPDLALVSTSTGNRSSSRKLFAVVECAFTQDRDNLMMKIRREVEGWPEIVLVVTILVSEAHNYKSPPPDSQTWNYFARHESVLSFNDFLSLPASIDKSATSTQVEYYSSDSDSERVKPNPITIAGHTWCEINDVQYRVWVQEDGVLDLDGDSTIGFLYPKISEMEEVEVAINNGLSAVKHEIDELAAKTTMSGTTLRKLQEAELRVRFDWEAIQSAIKMAAAETAVSRYQTWFYDTFRGTKHSHPDDESYNPSESQSSSSVTSLEPSDPSQSHCNLRRKAGRGRS